MSVQLSALFFLMISLHFNLSRAIGKQTDNTLSGQIETISERLPPDHPDQETYRLPQGQSDKCKCKSTSYYDRWYRAEVVFRGHFEEVKTSVHNDQYLIYIFRASLNYKNDRRFEIGRAIRFLLYKDPDICGGSFELGTEYILLLDIKPNNKNRALVIDFCMGLVLYRDIPGGFRYALRLAAEALPTPSNSPYPSRSAFPTRKKWPSQTPWPSRGPWFSRRPWPSRKPWPKGK